MAVSGSRRWPFVLLVGLVLVGLAVGCRRHLTSERARERAATYFEPVQRLEPAAPIHARAGERWTFEVASLYDRAAGTETWDVLAVGASDVSCRVTPAGGGPPRSESWSFVAPVRSERIVGGERVVLQVAGRSFTCDVVEVVVAGGVDRVRAWITVDPVTCVRPSRASCGWSARSSEDDV